MNLFLLRNTWGHNFFKKCRSHLKIHGTRRVTRAKVHTQNPQTLASPYKVYSPEWPDARDLCILEKYAPPNKKKSPKIKYKDNFTSMNFLHAKNDEKV